jgi:hypothetical protein
MQRDRLVKVMSWLSAIVAIVSLVAAIVVRSCYPNMKTDVGYPILALWFLGPPVWFWTEWILFSPSFDEKERDRVKHLHDLARNIWLALVVVLAAILEISVFK